MRTTLFLLTTVCLTAATTGTEVSASEREQALRLLTDSQDTVVQAVKGLSEAQWKFKPGPDRWSVAECVEHMAVTEDAISGLIRDIGKAPAPGAGHDTHRIDALLITKVPDRSTKAQAPQEIQPAGRWSGPDALEHLLKVRKQVIASLQSSPDLRGHVVNHPFFGPLDGYEWILLTATHSQRHTKQIVEVKADPHFPAR